MANANDERRHDPTDAELWNESWYFDFAAADGSVGGYVRLGLYPNLGVSWYWAYLVGDAMRDACGTDASVLAVKHHEAALPKAEVLEVREDGLWSALHCETPHDHWTIGLEAFAVALETPGDAYRGERGDKVAFGLDLEWEAAGPVYDYPGVTRYEQSCRVSGEILVGQERIEFDASGQRDHSWGVRDWWRTSWVWTAGALDDGTRFHGTHLFLPGDARYEPAYAIDPASGELRSAVDQFDADVENADDEDRFPVRTGMRLLDLDMVCEPVGFAPVQLEAPDGRIGRFPRAMCRFTTVDGARSGYGWTEWNQPPPAQNDALVAARADGRGNRGEQRLAGGDVHQPGLG